MGVTLRLEQWGELKLRPETGELLATPRDFGLVYPFSWI